MSNQDEPITNNPLLPFLRIPPSSCQESTVAHPPSLTPVETLAVGQQVGVARVEEEEEEEVLKPSMRNFCPSYKVLYIKEGEIRLLGLHVSS